MNAIGSVINQIDSLVWGWWMIILLLGTHIFMTIRTGVIQRKMPLLLAVPVQSSGAGLPVSSESPPNTVSLSSL